MCSKDPIKWNTYLNSNDKFNETPPDHIKSNQKLLLTKIFNPDRIVGAMEDFVREELGYNFINPLRDPLEVIM